MKSSNYKADIIGAGIGGLTTAAFLQDKGLHFDIYEKAKKFASIGSGIVLANNAMQVYHKLGVKEEIESEGNIISSINIVRPDLSPISKMNLTYFEKKYAAKNIAIHRASLHKILVNKVNRDSIKLDHELESLKQRKDGNTTLIFKNRKPVISKLVLGSDGIRSIIRDNLFPNNRVRSAKQICWRGVVNFKLPAKYFHELNEAWGRGSRFGFVQIGSDKVYWYAVKSNDSNKDDLSMDNLIACFEPYHPIINDIVSSTPEEGIYTDDICDLFPLKTWFKKNVCLIGDAAHATTPNMGQGACQAIEDAFTISECLSKYDIEQAFLKYQKLRQPKACQVVKTSWMIGRLAHLSNPFAISVRNTLLQAIPEIANRKQLEAIFRLSKL